MSGHSKWSQIKRQKGAADLKRGQLFSKLTLPIILAAKNGADPEANFALKMAVEKAKAANMPKENIERAIARGSGKAGSIQIEEVVYEAIGPSNIAIIIETATDNKNRTAGAIKSVLTKFGGKLTGSGAATYLFNRMGKLLVEFSEQNKDEIEMAAIDAGAEDIEEQTDVVAIYTAANELEKVKKSLDENNIQVREAALSWEPKTTIKIEDPEIAGKIINLMDALDELEDVSAVSANFDIAEALIKG